MTKISTVRIDTNFNIEKTIGADRVKFAIPIAEIKEAREYAIKNLNNDAYKKNPTNKPIFRCFFNEQVVMVDVCVSKMLFHNNLEEAAESDFDLFISKIQGYAYAKGLIISKNTMAHAAVWYLEYGKNILLPNKYSMPLILTKLRAALDKKGNTYEVAKYSSKVGNKGFSVSLLTEGKKSIIYDKTTKEIYASKDPKNKTVYQQLLMSELQVLRIEIKYFHSADVKKAFSTKLRKANITLADIWNGNLAHNTIQDWWEGILANIPHRYSRKSQIMKYLNQTVENNVSIQDTLIIYAFNDLIAKFGSIALKQMLMPIRTKLYSKARQQQYSAIQKKIKKYQDIFSNGKNCVISKITEYINNFIAIRLERSEDFGSEDQIIGIRGKF